VPTLQVDDTNCNYPCSGDINQVCGGNGVQGGGAFISVFHDTLSGDGGTTPTPSGPVVNPGVDGYTHIGCYTEGSNGRALPNAFAVAPLTVAKGIQACAGKYTL